MEAKEILARVKEFFNELTAPAPAPAAPAAPVQMSEYDLKDGGKVTIDKLEAGGVVMIDGAPALPGELELADGTKLAIAENGIIAEVMPGGAPAAPEAREMDMGSKFAAFETLAKEKYAQFEAQLAECSARFAAQEVQLAKATKVIEELLKLSTLLAEAPAAPADPVVKGAASFKAEKKVPDILFS